MDGWTLWCFFFFSRTNEFAFPFSCSAYYYCYIFLWWHLAHVALPHVSVVLTISTCVLCCAMEMMPDFLEGSIFSVSPQPTPCAFPKVGHLPVPTRWKIVGSLKTAAAATSLSGFRKEETNSSCVWSYCIKNEESIKKKKNPGVTTSPPVSIISTCAYFQPSSRVKHLSL